MILKVGSDIFVSAMNANIVDLLIAVYSARALYDDWNVKYKSTHHKLPIKYCQELVLPYVVISKLYVWCCYVWATLCVVPGNVISGVNVAGLA